MRRSLVVALVVLAACGGEKKQRATAADPAASTGPGQAGIAACRSVVAALDASQACAASPEERELFERSNRLMREQYASARPLSDAETPIFARACVRMLGELVAEYAWNGCKIPLTPDETAWIEREQKHRTPVPADATGATRAALAGVAKLRDQVCDCKTVECTKQVETELDGGGAISLPDGSDVATRDLMGVMLEEFGGCVRHVEGNVRRAGPPPPRPDLAEIRAQLAQLHESDKAKAADEARPLADQVTLPDGKVLRPADCPADPFDHDLCVEFFKEVGGCRAEDPDARAPCEQQAIADYVELTAPDEDEDEEELDAGQ